MSVLITGLWERKLMAKKYIVNFTAITGGHVKNDIREQEAFSIKQADGSYDDGAKEVERLLDMGAISEVDESSEVGNIRRLDDLDALDYNGLRDRAKQLNIQLPDIIGKQSIIATLRSHAAESGANKRREFEAEATIISQRARYPEGGIGGEPEINTQQTQTDQPPSGSQESLDQQSPAITDQPPVRRPGRPPTVNNSGAAATGGASDPASQSGLGAL